MADSIDKGIKHTLKRCDEIREKYVTTNNNPFDVDYEPHLIEIRTDDVTNINEPGLEDHPSRVSDMQRYDIIKFLETQAGEIINEKVVMFNVTRADKDLLLSSVLKPSTLRQREDHDHMNIINKRYKARVI